ncbi:MAG: zinc ribbon domain-containing protein [Clostridiales bacterium]|nr:zinc ribbon domain-containing protein [Clostridiales bacterium]
MSGTIGKNDFDPNEVNIACPECREILRITMKRCPCCGYVIGKELIEIAERLAEVYSTVYGPGPFPRAFD